MQDSCFISKLKKINYNFTKKSLRAQTIFGKTRCLKLVKKTHYSRTTEGLQNSDIGNKKVESQVPVVRLCVPFIQFIHRIPFYLNEANRSLKMFYSKFHFLKLFFLHLSNSRLLLLLLIY